MPPGMRQQISTGHPSHIFFRYWFDGFKKHRSPCGVQGECWQFPLHRVTAIVAKSGTTNET
ncbi:MAG: hypothetical protein CMJ81_24810 [Planctomycetaceae bacterium]|nr:hypothetical protein [Planctomycetaceae bacterium]MBP61305.1 hypothetical protein [Planctomycetaceae bacterium]